MPNYVEFVVVWKAFPGAHRSLNIIQLEEVSKLIPLDCGKLDGQMFLTTSPPRPEQCYFISENHQERFGIHKLRM